MSVRLSYELIGRGWIKCVLAIGDHEVEVTASYLSDCLDDLLRAATAALNGMRDIKVVFCEEPGEYR